MLKNAAAAAVKEPNCRKLKLSRASAAHFSPAVKRGEVNACGLIKALAVTYHRRNKKTTALSRCQNK
jgi:hypothetical protein